MKMEENNRINNLSFEDLDLQMEQALKNVKKKTQRKVIDLCLCEPHTYYQWEIRENKCDNCKKEIH